MSSEVGVEVEADNKQDDFRFWGCHEENSVVVVGLLPQRGWLGKASLQCPRLKGQQGQRRGNGETVPGASE